MTENEIIVILEDIAAGNFSKNEITDFLTALSKRGETVAEMTGAAKFLRGKVEPVNAPADAIDCCGTGGDHADTYNISTAVAFVLAACGVPVAKHGNRAASSKSGAADVLEALGVNLELTKAQCEEALRLFNFCFLMAPNHHKVLKPLAALRKELGFRTIFNLMGPLANPAQTKRQLIGVYDKKLLIPYAETLRNLGALKVWIVHGSDGLDEITLTGKTHCAILDNGEIIEKTFAPDDFGLPIISSSDIKGGTAQENALALVDLLNSSRSAYRDIVLANAAAGLVIAEKAFNLKDGVALAAKAIDDGGALNVLNSYRDDTSGT